MHSLAFVPMKTSENQAALVTGPKRLELVPRPVREPREDEALVRVAYLGLCGTDAELVTGTSALFKEGKRAFPFVFGHEWSGTVEKMGRATSSFAAGDWVVGHPFHTCGSCSFCHAGLENQCLKRSEMGVWGEADGAAQHFVNVPLRVLRRVPDGVDLRDAVLAEPAVTVVEALAATNPRTHEEVAIIGSGTLAQIAAQILTSQGINATVLSNRAGDAGGIGWLPIADAEGSWFDVVLDFAGSAVAAENLSRIIRPGGRIALAGLSHESVSEYSLAPFVYKSVSIFGILHGISRYSEALELIRRKVIRPSDLIDRELDWREISTAVERLVAGVRSRPKIIVNFQS